MPLVTPVCPPVVDPPVVVVPPTGASISQREVVFNTLKDVVLHAGSLVNFGAMVYGGNNSGANVVAGMADLSVDVTTNLDGDYNVIVDPDCDSISSRPTGHLTASSSRRFPAPPSATATDLTDCSEYDGAGCVSSNTARPQAESLFDAGYYFGAGRTGEVDASTYTSITNNMQIDSGRQPLRSEPYHPDHQRLLQR